MKKNRTKLNALKIKESKTNVYESLYRGSYLCSNTIMNKRTSTVKRTILQKLPQAKIFFFDKKDR